MSVSRFLSAIERGPARPLWAGKAGPFTPPRVASRGWWLALALAGCGGSPCGPGGAPATGLLASSADVTLTYGNLTASANNDCPGSNPKAGVVSLTIEGAQTDGGGLLTLCVPRPDELENTPQALGTDVQVVDFSGDKNGCPYAFDTTRPPSAMATTTGMCDNGTNKAGFALSLSGALSLTRCPPGMPCDASCGGTTSVAVQLSGTVAVMPHQ
jgi:hypothetical protein